MKKSLSFITALILIITLLIPVSFAVSADSTDILRGKSVLVVGDDISKRCDDGWGGRLERVYGMEMTPMHSSSGITLSDWRKDTSGSIISMIPTLGTQKYDYVLLHGGMADAEDNKIDKEIEGVVTGAVMPHDYSIPEVPQNVEARTFARGLERLIQAAIKKYNGARIGFIINYATPNNPCKNAQDMSRYWEVARQVCDKWDIPYFDMYDGKTADGKSYSYDILDMDVEKSPYHNNKKHLKAAGYDAITPYIAQWMTTIKPYDLQATLATAPTTTTTKRTTTTTTTTTTGAVVTSKTSTAKTSDATAMAPTTTKTTAGSTKSTSRKTETLSSATTPAEQEELAPENSVPVEGVDTNNAEADAPPIVLIVAILVAAVAVIVALIIVIIKRVKG